MDFSKRTTAIGSSFTSVQSQTSTLVQSFRASEFATDCLKEPTKIEQALGSSLSNRS